MTWPVERDSVLSSAQLVSEWDESGEGEKEVRDILDTLTIDEGRAVVMARPDEFQRVFGAEGKTLDWESEPWYGTKYLVERFDEDFASRVSANPIRCTTTSELFVQGSGTERHTGIVPSEAERIPPRESRRRQARRRTTRKAPSPDPGDPALTVVAQERRPVLGAESTSLY